MVLGLLFNMAWVVQPTRWDWCRGVDISVLCITCCQYKAFLRAARPLAPNSSDISTTIAHLTTLRCASFAFTCFTAIFRGSFVEFSARERARVRAYGGNLLESSPPPAESFVPQNEPSPRWRELEAVLRPTSKRSERYTVNRY